MNKSNIANRVSFVTIIINIVLVIFKIIAGIIGHSSALISDAVHSLSDVFSTVVVIIGVNMSNKKEDACHPYGHERLECVAAIALSAILFATGFGIGLSGIKSIINLENHTIVVPTSIALIAAIVSIVANEWMYWYTRAAGKKINSGALIADAWHHRSDALSSVGSLIGVGGSMLGFKILDPLASIAICIMIFKAAYDIAKDAIDQLVDKSAPQEVVEQMKREIESQQGVMRLDDIKTRVYASKLYVDVEIAVDSRLSLHDAHEISMAVHQNIENMFEDVKHCMVHVNPYYVKQDFEIECSETIELIDNTIEN